MSGHGVGGVWRDGRATARAALRAGVRHGDLRQNGRMHSKLDLAVGHLHAAVGTVVRAEDLARALREGSVVNLASGPEEPLVRGLLHSVFVEIDPALILSCAREAQSDWQHAHQLYTESLADGLPRVKAWEQLVAQRT